MEKYSERFLGDGLRYEISDFLSMINGRNSSEFKLTRSESVALADMMEKRCFFSDIIIVPTGGISTVYANDGGIVIAY